MPSFNDLYYGQTGNIRLKPENASQLNVGLTYSKRISDWLPYVSASYASYERLNGLKTFVMDAGINYLIQGHQSKLSLNFQNRPTYGIENGVVTAGKRKNSLTLQYQIFL